MAQRSKSRPAAQAPAARSRGSPLSAGLARRYAFVVVSTRYVVVVGWLAAAALATHYLPSLSAAAGVGDLVPAHSAALRAEGRRDEAVQGADERAGRRRAGRPARASDSPYRSARPAARSRSTKAAAPRFTDWLAHCPWRTPQGRYRAPGIGRPRSSHSCTSGQAPRWRPRLRAARPTLAPAASGPRAHVAGVTGPIPARYRAGPDHRALPAVGRGGDGPGHLRDRRLALQVVRSAARDAVLRRDELPAGRARRGLGRRADGSDVPPDLEPVLVVLLLGVTTDYCVFFLSGMRTRLAEGTPRLPPPGSRPPSTRRSSWRQAWSWRRGPPRWWSRGSSCCARSGQDWRSRC